MTAIVPTIPGLPGEVASPLRVAQDRPGTSFAGLLAQANGAARSGSMRAYTFAELGMFGRHGPLDGFANAGLNRPHALDGNHCPSGPSGEAEGRQSRSRASTDNAAGDGDPLKDVPHVASSAQRLTTTKVMATNDSSGAQRWLVPLPMNSSTIAKIVARSGKHAAIAAANEGGQACPARPLLPATATAINLAVSTSGNAAHVIARSEAETPEMRARLRRLIADTLNEFGLGLAELHLDGSAEEPSFQSIMGGIHGARQR